MKNVGTGDLGRTADPAVRASTATNTLLPPVELQQQPSRKCPSTPLPAGLHRRASRRATCLVYLVARPGHAGRGELPAAAGRSSRSPGRARSRRRAAKKKTTKKKQEEGTALTAPSRCPPAAPRDRCEVATPVVLAPMAGHHQRGLPPAVPRAGRGPLRLRDDHQPRPGRGRRDHPADAGLRRAGAVRSVQLYGTDPAYVGKATEILCAEYGVAHVDLNFGCPVPKVTRKGGGAALPWKRTLLGEILEAAVAGRRRAYDVPVTMKTRKGIDDDHLTYLDAGRIAQESGAPRSRCTAAPRSRATPAPPTGTRSRGWSSTSTSRCSATATSGRPPTRCGWSSRPAPPASSSAAAAWAGRGCSATWPPRSPASRGRHAADASARCAAMMRRHAELLVPAHGGGARLQGVPQARLVVPQGLPRRRRPAPRPGPGRARWPSSTGCSPQLDPDEPFPVAELGTPRGRQGSPRKRRGTARRGGSTTPTAPGASYARTRRRPPAAERRGAGPDHPARNGPRGGGQFRRIASSRASPLDRAEPGCCPVALSGPAACLTTGTEAAP